MCIAVPDHVVCFNLYVGISNQRQAERKVENFASFSLVLVTGKKLNTRKMFREQKRVSLKKVNSSTL